MGLYRLERRKPFFAKYKYIHIAYSFLEPVRQGVSNVFDLRGPHWKKRNCLGPHLKYTNSDS